MVDGSEKFRWLVRLGFAARGLVYIILGYLALTTAGDAKDGGTAVFELLQDVPLGTVVLWPMAVGLGAYALFKFISALADVENRGSDARGIVKRIGDGASGVAHSILAYAAFQFATGSPTASGGGAQGSREAAGSLLEIPLGDLLIGIVGLGFLIGAFMQARSAATAGFMSHVSARAPAAIETVGRIGHAARAIVFAIVGWSLVQSAWFESESRVKGLGDAILSLRSQGTLYTLVAAGLVLFGVFSVLVARYRIIPDVHRGDLKPSLG